MMLKYKATWSCRFVSVDPLAAKYANLSPYNYADNTPVTDKDIDGMQNTTSPQTPTSATPQSPSSNANNNQSATAKVHIVKKGETLSEIAKESDITVDALRKANNLDPKNDTKLQIGTKLKIPGANSDSSDFNGMGSIDISKGVAAGHAVLKKSQTQQVLNTASGLGIPFKQTQTSTSFFQVSPLGPSLGIAGTPIIYKPWLSALPKSWGFRGFVMEGSIPFTSPASVLSRRIGLGGAFDRAVPGIGWSMTVGEQLFNHFQIATDTEVLQKYDSNMISNPYRGFVIDGLHILRIDWQKNQLKNQKINQQFKTNQKTNPYRGFVVPGG